MSVLSRFKDIVSANVNALLDKAEDPAKMCDETLRQLREDLAQVKKETAGVMANEKRDKRLLDDCKAEVSKFENAAKNALKAGNEEDAKKLIAEKQKSEANLASLEANYKVSHENSEKMRQMHNKLVEDIDTLDKKRATIKATVANAKARETVNKAVGAIDSSKGIAAFNKYEEKAQKMLDEAEAVAELDEDTKNSDADKLADKYNDANENSPAVEEELAKMKEELGL